MSTLRSKSVIIHRGNVLYVLYGSLRTDPHCILSLTSLHSRSVPLRFLYELSFPRFADFYSQFHGFHGFISMIFNSFSKFIFQSQSPKSLGRSRDFGNVPKARKVLGQSQF